MEYSLSRWAAGQKRPTRKTGWRSDGATTVPVALGAPAGSGGNGALTDGPIAKGGASYIYQVCVAGDWDSCSDPAAISF